MFPNFYIINTFRTRYCHFFVYNSSLLTFECLFVVFYRILLHCHFENIVLDFECLSLLLWLLSISTFHSFNCVVLVRSSNVDWRLNFLLKFFNNRSRVLLSASFTCGADGQFAAGIALRSTTNKKTKMFVLIFTHKNEKKRKRNPEASVGLGLASSFTLEKTTKKNTRKEDNQMTSLHNNNKNKTNKKYSKKKTKF